MPLWQRGAIRPLASKAIIDEYLRVLTYPKFKLTEEDINFLLYHKTLPYFEVIDVQPGPRIVRKDPEDDKFLRCALAGKAKWIISGDHHLLALKPYQKIKILTPSDFLLKA
jgi:putative PIN family toxin of toxin-antitoxin system